MPWDPRRFDLLVELCAPRNPRGEPIASRVTTEAGLSRQFANALLKGSSAIEWGGAQKLHRKWGARPEWLLEGTPPTGIAPDGLEELIALGGFTEERQAALKAGQLRTHGAFVKIGAAWSRAEWERRLDALVEADRRIESLVREKKTKR